MRRSIALISGGVVVMAVLALLWCRWQLNHPGPLPPGGAIVSVVPGEAFRKTADKLASAGVVRHAWLVHWYARWTGVDRSIQTGDYRFEEPQTPIEVLEVLRTAAMALNRVTIPEGFNVRQVAAQLEAAGFGGADEYLCAARDPDLLRELELPTSGIEGYLFPDTYAFPLGTPPRDILRTMVRRFRDQVDRLAWEQTTSPLGQFEVLTLASLVEKETGVAEERPLIAGVFQNRLRIGMKLQSDPTAIYGLKEGVPTAADLKVDSPYNTYLYLGLPPGPICNPGIAAIRAAFNPATTPYFFFVAKPDGTHDFSTTLEQHNRAVSNLRRSAG